MTGEGQGVGWRLQVLEGPRLVGPGVRLEGMEHRTAALLAYLALEGETPRARLAGLLYPDAPTARARNNLVHLLRRLRRAAGAALVEGDQALRLVGGLEIDAQAALRGEGPWPEGRAELLSSLELSDLPDLEEWVLAWRERLLEARRAAALRAVAAAQARGDHAAAVTALQALLNADLLSEDIWRHLMRAHYLAGDRPAALQAYARCCEVLQREVGGTPEPETQALARRIDRGEVLPDAAARPTPLPLAVLRPPALVGRETSWAQLEAAWRRHQTIYITGEAGVGKTRLAQDFVGSKGRALYLPGHVGAEHTPFAAATHNARARLAAAPHVTLPGWVRRELGRLLPELGQGDPPQPIASEADRLNYYLAHLEVVRLTSPGFAAVINDDVQHYDPATVELGAFFLTQGDMPGGPDEGPRHLILYRQGHLPPSTQARVDGLVDRGVAARIELAPLDPGGVADLLAALPEMPPGAADLPHKLHSLTGGNPQFMLEALRHMFQTGKFEVDDALRARASGVTSLIAGRLAGLSPTALQAARGAAVLEDGFSLERLAEVLGTGLLALAIAWEELEAAQVVSGERLSHDRVREALLGGMSPGVRTLLHRAGARVLAQHSVHPSQVARHWREAGELHQAAEWLFRAGQAAQATLREAEAADFYAQAAQTYAAVSDLDGARRSEDARQAALTRLEVHPALERGG
ncbi:BTAD domain-containing putative transcriptional regulator [Deinococcus hopiensis]|uniref:DNA-binding transcriptional activator of the SARP family n=1 Tax=Deinococcus hopiensis KR-140 TaxID=695939 RepID=A0A1W1UD87_9DEIO|nr:BTAD domain-containing putative transcriptional regulator [Deinococcus hopiensis]SMB79020.1 DNA-binding transcriptional activator of the SARP family [Deinococcus hopiensis KR-140]